MQDIADLEGTHTLKILLALYKDDRMPKGILYQKTSWNASAVAKKIEELQKIDLVLEEEEDKHLFRKYISLTPKGRRVAEKFAEIEGILGEN